MWWGRNWEAERKEVPRTPLIHSWKHRSRIKTLRSTWSSVDGLSMKVLKQHFNTSLHPNHCICPSTTFTHLLSCVPAVLWFVRHAVRGVFPVNTHIKELSTWLVNDMDSCTRHRFVCEPADTHSQSLPVLNAHTHTRTPNTLPLHNTQTEHTYKTRFTSPLAEPDM